TQRPNGNGQRPAQNLIQELLSRIRAIFEAPAQVSNVQEPTTAGLDGLYRSIHSLPGKMDKDGNPDRDQQFKNRLLARLNARVDELGGEVAKENLPKQSAQEPGAPEPAAPPPPAASQLFRRGERVEFDYR